MLPASNRGVGLNIGFPDICPTPVGPVVVPIPYPNLALHATAAPFSPNLMITGMNALNMGSMIPMTHGDDAGVAGPHMGPGTFTMGYPTILVNALPAVHLTSPTAGNNMINPIGAVLVPAVTTVFMGLRADANDEGPSDATELAELARLLDDPELASELLPSGVGHVRWARFTPDLPARVARALDALTARGALACVLDLRGSPGGDVDAALRLAADFLDDGDIVAWERDSDGDVTPHTTRHARVHSVSLAILVDGGTASAAEVFAGALQARGRAVLVGSRTYGKASMQRLTRGEDGLSRVTVARFEVEEGRALDGRGLEPDLDTTDLSAEDALVAAALLALARRA